MNVRTDIHRPSAIVPNEYEFITMNYIGPSEEWMDFKWERKALRDHMAATGGTEATHDHGGTCGTCGATAFYVGHFYHAKTNTYLTVGHECAGKFGLGDPAAFKNFRKAVAARRKAAKGKGKASKILIDAGLSAAWDIYAAEDRSGYKYEEATIMDIVGKLVRYGSVTDKALNYVRVLLNKIPARAEMEAKRAAETAAAAPVPVTDAKIKIAGEVLTVKAQETRYGVVTKMLIKTDAGWKIWGTVPSAMPHPERGDRVSLEATVVPSKDDPKFGFYSRPKMGVNHTARKEKADEDLADRKLDWDDLAHTGTN